MLKRVQKISNIGRFKDASCGAAEFDRISIIYGRNTYGKSTLSDLFSSIKSNNLEALEKRRTIPNDTKPQEASLSFLFSGESKESSIVLNSGGWNGNIVGKIGTAIFDDGFFHNNLFAARQFTRSTKENLSAFILGEDGVANAKTIAESKKLKSDKTREQNQLKKDAFQDILNLDEFIKLTSEETIEEIEKRINELRDEYASVKKQRDNIDEIKKRKLCTHITNNYVIKTHLGELNAALSLSLDTHHDEAKIKVTEHIKAHFNNAEGAEQWLRKGLEDNNGENCQFCGQALGDQAKHLLSLYRDSFNTAFRQHEQKVKQQIDSAINNLKLVPFKNIQITLEANRTVCESYPELKESTDYTHNTVELENHAVSIESVIADWEIDQELFWETLENVRKAKERSPHNKIEPILAERLVELIESLARHLGLYNAAVEEINSQISTFKSSMVLEALDKRIKELADEGKKNALLKKRQEKREQVDRFQSLGDEITHLNMEIPNLEMQLRDQQSQFLSEYFISLNRWFKAFGSDDFSLELGSDSSGHTPVYFLKVKFKNKPITEKHLDRVFSESDRRALAPSVFWAHLSSLSEAEKKNLIVVLDDPVTSFDNGRITAVHQEIIRLYQQVRQIIILSHYNVEVSKFLSTYRKNHPIALLSIELKSGSSTLTKCDISEFIRSEHEQKSRRITDFVNGLENSHHAGDLRVFFETEINFRFAKQLQEIGSMEALLSEKIDSLVENGYITQDIADESHVWRETLNPSHHTWTDDDIEDQRKTAGRFMDFVYHKLSPSS